MKPSAPATWLVAQFECGNYLRSRSFLVSTLLSMLLLALSLSLPKLTELAHDLQLGAGETLTIQVVNMSELALEEAPLQALLPDYDLSLSKDFSEARLKEALENKDFAGAFFLHTLDDFEWVTARQRFAKTPEESLNRHLRQEVKDLRMRELQLDLATRQQLLESPKLLITESASLAGKSLAQTQLYTYILILLLYMSTLNYGQLTAVSIASEKSTRAMEILITSTRPKHLINGKVLGTGLAGLFQMLMLGAVYYLFRFVHQESLAQSSLFSGSLNMPLPTFGMAVLIFVLNYLTFAFLFGALGSLVNRSEEVNQVIAPINLIYVGVIMAGLAGTFLPEASWVQWASFLPLIGPLLYFVRFSMLDLATWELLLPLLIHFATVVLASRLARHIYQRGVLRYGQEARFREVFRLFRDKASTKESSS